MKIGDIIDINEYTEAAAWCNSNGARLAELDQKDGARRFVIEKDEKSDAEKKKEQIDALKFYLRDTEWIVMKILEKKLSGDEKGAEEDLKKYADVLEQRQAARRRIEEEKDVEK